MRKRIWILFLAAVMTVAAGSLSACGKKIKDTEPAVSGNPASPWDGSEKPARTPAESRIYQSAVSDYVYINVNIYDDGDWQMESLQWYGSASIWADYSNKAAEKGEYVQVAGYDLEGEDAAPLFLGLAKFTMTEEQLTVQYKDSTETNIYNRVRQQ